MPPTDEDIAWFKSTFRTIPKPELPEDCIDYSIHLFSADIDTSHDSELRVQLRDVQKSANELQKQWLKEYIWQRQGFSLELVKEDGTSCLRGRTEYGDSIEDEWVVVWLLRELTKKFRNTWAKVTDSDGEFLLIEASGTIPGWLEPEVAENRVWITDGQLKIIKPAGTARSSKRTAEKISLQDARQVILKERARIMHSSSIEAEAFYRLRNYPQQIKENMHHALATLPRKVAFLLMQRPAYVAPAIEAFYLRDPIALKPLQKPDNEDKLLLPPRDLVTISVRFPKVGYAQVKSQEFPAPPVWNSRMPSKLESILYAHADVGMKLTSGFEMLLSDPQHQDKQAVREMKLLLEDLETGDERLPSDADLDKLPQTEDDEKWLDINMEDLDNELSGKQKASTGANGRKPEFGDKAAQENLQRIVKQFEDFLNDEKSGVNEAGMFDEESEDDLSDDDDDDDEDGNEEDKDASFDEDEFTKMMQEMMGMPSDVMQEIMSGTIDALSNDRNGPASVRERAMEKVKELDTDDDEDEDEDEDDVLDMKQMEAELRASGALDLTTRKSKNEGSTLALPGGVRDQHENDDAEESSDDDDDFDADFARNILMSFKSSGGSGGPAANLLSMLNEQASEGSKTKGKGRETGSK